MRPPKKFLAFKISASLFAAVATLYLARDVALPRAVVLSLSACADTTQTLRAFYSDGSAPGFCRTRFTEQTIGRTGQFVRLNFDLPVVKLAGLRLQLGDRPGRIVLKDVQLRPRGDLGATVLRRCRLRQIVVAGAAHGQVELLLSDSSPLLLFKSRDVAATARRYPKPALVFSIGASGFVWGISVG